MYYLLHAIVKRKEIDLEGLAFVWGLIDLLENV